MTAISITEASARGISALAKEASAGEHVQLTSHGKLVAEVLPAGSFDLLTAQNEELEDLVILMARVLTDDGVRVPLSQAIEFFGLDPDELIAEVDAELGQASD